MAWLATSYVIYSQTNSVAISALVTAVVPDVVGLDDRPIDAPPRTPGFGAVSPV